MADGTNGVTRRDFLAKTATVVAAASVMSRYARGQDGLPANEKLNLAGIGVGGMGFHDLRNFAGLGHNIVALCDVDRAHAAKALAEFPKAKVYSDFRVMFEQQKDIDGVVVATPDHLHAIVAITAMKHGKHVYGEKPLAHSVYETREMARIARETKLATQMGNQGQASEEARVTIEMIQSGAIGTVTEVHAWSNRTPDISRRGIPRPSDTPPVPDSLNWDLWLGPSPVRPYNPIYLPFHWRGWWDFGTGVLGDIGCHQLSTIFKCLKLGHPESVEACSTNWQQGPEIANETAPLASTVRFRFAASADHGPLQITWYDGGMQPTRPAELEPRRPFGVDDGILYVGDKGKMLGHRLIPETRMAEYGKPERKLPRSPGHYQEWIAACKGGPAAGANFVDHAAHLAEVILLGNVAIRMNGKLAWDGEAGRFTDCDEANALLNPPYRKGWVL
jgi:predicted dehydrogenase